MRKDFMSAYIADWSVWPIINVVNFRFVPLAFRPSFIGINQLFWQTYMVRSVSLGV
jgi:protein Mpv17